MSADYGTEHFKGFHHRRHGGEWIHVTHRRDDSGALGDFSREEIAELVELAEQAWPGLSEELAAAVAARKARELAELADAWEQAADGPSGDAEHAAARDLVDAVRALLPHD